MPATPLAARLQVRPGRRLHLIGAPSDPASVIGPLPDGASIVEGAADADVVLLFVRDRADLAARWPAVGASLRPDAVIWIAYPKRSGPIRTDLTRDAGWAPVFNAGFDPVSQVAIDATWSALRFTRDPALRAARAARGARVGGR